MKSLRVALLIFAYFGVISARNILSSKSKVDIWLDISTEDLENQYVLRNNEPFDGKILSEFNSELMDFMDTIQKLPVEDPDFLMQHIYNPNMIQKLKDVITFIQNCLDEKDRLDPVGVAEVMERVLRAHAIKVSQIAPLSRQDFGCFESKRVEQSENANFCFKNISEPRNKVFKVYNVLMLEFVTDTTCEKMLPSVECVMNYIVDCTPKARKFLKMVLSPAEIGICENFPQEKDSNLIEDIGDVFDRKENPFPFRKFLHFVNDYNN